MAITINLNQLPSTPITAQAMRWDCDEFIIIYHRGTETLAIECFEGFDEDTGEELTEVITDARHIDAILSDYKPGWPSLDGFTTLKDYYGDRWTIGTVQAI